MSGGTVSALGVKLEGVPRWALALAALAVVGVGSWLMLRPSKDLVSAQAASAALQLAVDEYGRHIVESPEAAALMMNDARGKLSVRQYADGCLLIAREVAGQVRSKLVVDLARTGQETGLAGSTSDDRLPGGGIATGAGRSPRYGPRFAAYEGPAAAQRCWNPHPGEFRTWYGRRSGCRVEVWREWPDGCQHVQMLDTCSGAWDSHPDGSPRVRWARCVH